MSHYYYPISVTFRHQIYFCRNAFSLDQDIVKTICNGENPGNKVFLFIETAVRTAQPMLIDTILKYVQQCCPQLEWCGSSTLEGGEACKNNRELCEAAFEDLRNSGLDRHSYVFCVGGGAFLDMIGFVTATTHRGLRLVRFPTTTLSQDDSGVGVKNGINQYGIKNFWGTFSVPYAVVMDLSFLDTQPLKSKKEGLVEAVKVSLVKDSDLFDWIELNIKGLSKCEPEVLDYLVERSAVLHAEHIATSGDPFEMGSSRPLDYGHWSAHKMEALSQFRLSHAQAVAIGIAIDVIYATLIGLMEPEQAQRILNVLDGLGYPLWDSCLSMRNEKGQRVVLEGLNEFREHLGGELTVLMVTSPGQSMDVNEIDLNLMDEAIQELETYA